jgi:hypothetical protein
MKNHRMVSHADILWDSDKYLRYKPNHIHMDMSLTNVLKFISADVLILNINVTWITIVFHRFISIMNTDLLMLAGEMNYNSDINQCD